MIIEITGYRSNDKEKNAEKILSFGLKSLYKHNIGIKTIYRIENRKLSVYMQFITSMDDDRVKKIVEHSGLLELFDYCEVSSVSESVGLQEVCWVTREAYRYTQFPKLIDAMFRKDVLLTHKEDILSSLEIPEEVIYYKPIKTEEYSTSKILNLIEGKNIQFEISIVPVNYEIEKEKGYLENRATLFNRAIEGGVFAFLTKPFKSDVIEKIFHKTKFDDMVLNTIQKESSELYRALYSQSAFFTNITLKSNMSKDELCSFADLLKEQIFLEGVGVYAKKEVIQDQRLPFLYTKDEIEALHRLLFINDKKELSLSFGKTVLQGSKRLQKIEEGLYASDALQVNSATAKETNNLLKEYLAVFMAFDAQSKTVSKAKIESDILDIALENIDAVKVYNIDTNLHSAQWNISNFKQSGHYVKLADTSKVEKEIAILYNELSTRAELLDESVKTIEAYNKHAFVKEDIYIFAIDMQTFLSLSNETKEKIKNIVNSAKMLGVYVLFYASRNDLQSIDKQIDIATFIFEEKSIVTNQKSIDTIYIDKELPIELILQIEKKIEEMNPFNNFLSIPIGYSPELKKEISFELGEKSEAYHALIVGTTGTGKTTLLNNIITRIAEQYSADEIQLILMDYKASGVEFDIFRTHPNVSSLYLDNTGYDCFMKVFKELQNEMERRGKLFAEQKVTKIDDYNNLSNVKKIPHIVLVVDEIQKLFKNFMDSYDYKKELLQLVRESRSMGIALVFATQSLSGLGLDDIIAQMRLRIAFQLSDIGEVRDVFGITTGNDAPLTLKRFQCIVNNTFGQPEGNVRIATYPEYKKKNELEEFFKEIRNSRNTKTIQADIFTKEDCMSNKDENQQDKVDSNENISIERKIKEELPFEPLSEDELKAEEEKFWSDGE